MVGGGCGMGMVSMSGLGIKVVQNMFVFSAYFA